ncbi:MAG: hypothetical protein NTX82_03675 [Candidatus Parcubacteria bacterium]|nr:hypothetical protein [Candidatus Parcubacteria bacterium]
MNIYESWQLYCSQQLDAIDICLHAKKRMRMRAWEELRDLTREELLALIRSGRLLEGKCSLTSQTFQVELIFSKSKICVVINGGINQLTTVENQHYHYDPEELANLSVPEQMRLRRQTKAYHLDLEARYTRGEFRGRKFKF